MSQTIETIDPGSRIEAVKGTSAAVISNRHGGSYQDLSAGEH